MKQVRITVEGKSSCLCTLYDNGKARVMMIDCVETKEAHQGKGYGAKLIGKAIELAKRNRIDAIELVANKDNLPAQRLYGKTGFTKTNKDHYRLILNKWT